MWEIFLQGHILSTAGDSLTTARPNAAICKAIEGRSNIPLRRSLAKNCWAQSSSSHLPG